MNTTNYLKRIGLNGVAADHESLALIHRQHLLHVPFENLDIHWNRPILLDVEKFYDKIVTRKRGGFCYELNGAFNVLLRSIGFQTRLVSARVFGAERGFGPEFDHAAIIVTIGEMEYLADVGFGDFTAEPLRIVPDIEQRDREGIFVLRRGDAGTLMVENLIDGASVPEYSFSLLGRDLMEFNEMCDFQQYSPESHFTQGKVCSIMTDTGRKTLTDSRFIVTSHGERSVTEVNSADLFDRLLNDEFGIKPLQ
ncbi:MAG: arylamine N-acetyltransferase [Pyrinomonadaceae bacterium]|nr:arylamine N-acetyltransferase [Pyrinomonadaceae bacterium]